ncbi:hypothetical protein [Muriicola sp. Z0-33]|uniref:hypothetical protein n=1 Tax=Muriicola sp. Z0-33 TaxID=2816957 RepID=UPI002237D658|nr:hypothetical protein [Muriicola sp. Z0-33]MCW5515346.1 hypothetical protein [Muriicola sp. Z0-33]
MNKKVSLFLGALMGMFISCSDETTIYHDDLKEDLVLEVDEVKLQGSLNYTKAGVLDILEENAITNKLSRLTGKPDEQAGDYPLTLIAQVNPPSYGSSNLTATHVDIAGDYAYVSYNTVGQEYFGAIQVINIGNPNNPRVTSQLIYLNADLNAIAYDGGYVYVVGGVDAEKSVRATSNALLAKIAVSGGRLITDNIIYGFQEGFNANSVVVNGASILVTSGKDGTLTSYSKSDLITENEVLYTDLRSVSVDNNNIALLDASSGVRVLNNSFQPIKDIPISTDFGAASKKTIDISGDKIIVAEASKGAGVYSYSTGSLLEYIPILINPEGVAESDINTNAVAINDDIILMANGGAGLCLSEKGTNNTNVYGIIALDGSTNFVVSKDDYVFAASGREGLQIIKLNRPNESLASICSGLPVYEGSSKLTVNSGDNYQYQGSKRFNNINVSGSLLLCGSWTVNNRVFVNDNALFEMFGTITVGKNNRRRNVTVDPGAILRIEGSLTIYGDLILEDGATIEFLGPDASANIFGSVVKNGTVTVSGTFDDVRNKF